MLSNYFCYMSFELKKNLLKNFKGIKFCIKMKDYGEVKV